MSTMGTCRICGEYCNMLSNYKCHECRRQEHFNKSETKQETNLNDLIQGRINQYELAQKNARDTTKLFNQGAIQGLKQALEIIEGR